MHIDFNKIDLCILGYIIYKTAYNWRQSLPPMPKTKTLNTAATHLFKLLCFSLCTWLWRQEISLRCGSVWLGSLFEMCILLCQLTKIRGYTYMKLKPTFSNLIFTVSFTLSFWLSFYKTIKYLNFRNAFSKINHSLLIVRIKQVIPFTDPLTAPSHNLNQCWLIISKVRWQSFEGNSAWAPLAINH